LVFQVPVIQDGTSFGLCLPYTWERSGQELKLKSVYSVTSLIPEQASSMLKAARELGSAFVAMINEADTISGKHHTDPQKLPDRASKRVGK
jgi:hypothetical protein